MKNIYDLGSNHTELTQGVLSTSVNSVAICGTYMSAGSGSETTFEWDDPCAYAIGQVNTVKRNTRAEYLSTGGTYLLGRPMLYLY